MVGAEEAILAVPCKPDSPGSKGKLPGLVHTTQANINKLFGLDAEGKKRAKPQEVEMEEKVVRGTDAPGEEDNLALHLMEEELAVLLAEQSELEAEEKRQAEEDDLRRLMAEERLLERLQEEERALQEALLQSLAAEKEAPSSSGSKGMLPPPPPVKPKHPLPLALGSESYSV